MAKSKNEKKSPSNASGEVGVSLQNFQLSDLAQYTLEKSFAANASKDFHLFYVGRDDVHDILKHILSRASVSIYLNMFGYDDDELNQILMEKAVDPNITMLITLDKSQANGPHEKALLDLDQQKNLAAYNTHFVVGQSATHQISHTKGFVVDGKVGAEGSTNWSASGEGTFAVTGKAGGAGYKAQNNTQSVFVDQDTISRFTAELIAEHAIAQGQSNAAGNNKQKALPVETDKAPAAAVSNSTTAKTKSTSRKKSN